MNIKIKGKAQVVPKLLLGIYVEKSVKDRIAKMAESRNATKSETVNAILVAGLEELEHENSIS